MRCSDFIHVYNLFVFPDYIKKMEAVPKCDLPCDSEESEFHNLRFDEREILSYRFSFPVRSLCPKHYKDQFIKYQGWHNKKCSDPCMRHKGLVKTNLKNITLSMARKVKMYTEYRVIPGKSLCLKCNYFLMEIISENEQQQKQLSEENESSQVGGSCEGAGRLDDSQDSTYSHR